MRIAASGSLSSILRKSWRGMRTTLEGSRATADTGRRVSLISATSPISAPGPTTVAVPLSRVTRSNEPSCTT